MGVIALWGAIVSFIGDGPLLVLSVLGFIHARRVSPTAEFMPKYTEQATAA